MLYLSSGPCSEPLRYPDWGWPSRSPHRPDRRYWPNGIRTPDSPGPAPPIWHRTRDWAVRHMPSRVTTRVCEIPPPVGPGGYWYLTHEEGQVDQARLLASGPPAMRYGSTRGSLSMKVPVAIAPRRHRTAAKPVERVSTENAGCIIFPQTSCSLARWGLGVPVTCCLACPFVFPAGRKWPVCEWPPGFSHPQPLRWVLFFRLT